MNSRLTEILAEKRKEVVGLKKRGVATNGCNDLPPIRDFKDAISRSDRINLIAEIKFASPSAGVIREMTDPLTVGKRYEEAGAAAISLLTDKRFFRGDIRYLQQLKRVTSIPILRKDFIIDERQIVESFLNGADALLLIARIVSSKQLRKLLGACQGLGIAALTEVHDRNDLDKAIDCKADIIGINNRDLDTFKVDLSTTLGLAPLVPGGHIIVSESGINNRHDVRVLKEAGVQAVLVGTALMKSKDMEKKAKGLAGAG